jgi:hypothetical protein
MDIVPIPKATTVVENLVKYCVPVRNMGQNHYTFMTTGFTGGAGSICGCRLLTTVAKGPFAATICKHEAEVFDCCDSFFSWKREAHDTVD